ncbi:MAG: hypothetical protein ACOWWH_14070 [Eubacteriaceae bacterium]
MELNIVLEYITLFVLQYVPNGLIYILAGYAFSRRTIDIKKYLFSSTILAVLGFATKILSETKLLNTSNSVPQILILFACIFLLVIVNKIVVVKAIISSLTVMLLQVFFEGIYILLVLKSIFKLDVHKIFEESVFKQSVLGLPNLILMAISILLFYKVMMKRRTE